MFGGLCFMLNDKMCLGVEQERLMVRLDPVKYDEAMAKEGARPMDFTGKVMKGFIFVDIDALNTEEKPGILGQVALEYNKIAKASKKKPKIRQEIAKTVTLRSNSCVKAGQFYDAKIFAQLLI